MSLLAKALSIRGVLLGLSEKDLDTDPVRQFHRWYAFARRVRCGWPDAFALATIGLDGRPAARMLLLKGVDERGFTFFTHYVGRKAEELKRVPFAAMVFHWADLVRQVRIEGAVERISWEESNAYFQRRLRGSRIGAWASRQSELLESRKAFMDRVKEYERKFRGGEVPLPPHWGGYRVRPEVIEFWQGRPNRLHDRFQFRREEDHWSLRRLYP